jgi:transposase-like protein
MNADTSPSKPLTKRNINRRIPISNKLKAILYAKEYGNHKASKKFNVDRKTIRYWRNQEQELQNAKNKNIRITLKHSGENRGVKKQKVSSINEITNQINFSILKDEIMSSSLSTNTQE